MPRNTSGIDLTAAPPRTKTNAKLSPYEMRASRPMSTTAGSQGPTDTSRLPLPSAAAVRSAPVEGNSRRSLGQAPVAGLMFWFERNRLSGSYFLLIRASLAYSSAP